MLNRVNWVEGDILDIASLQDAMQGVDVVIHCAAIVSFSRVDRKEMYKVNVEGTANVVNIALENGISKMIYVSSVAALGRKKDSSIVDESATWEESKNNTHYAISKFNAELEVWRGFAEGLKGFIVNPATIIGYGNWSTGSAALFKNIYKEFGWYSNGINGFTVVEDVATAMLMLFEAGVNEERYIICNDNWSFKKLFDTIAENFGKKKPYKEATPLISNIAWRAEKLKSIFTGKKPLITRETAKVANSHTQFDGTKLLKALPGFTYTPLEASIKTTCEKYILLAENQK